MTGDKIMKTRISKQDLKSAQVRYYHDSDLIDSKFDDFDSLYDAMNRSLRGRGLNRVEISNEATGFHAEYAVNAPVGVVLSWRRIG